MPGLMDLMGGLPPIQQTQDTGAPGVNTTAGPVSMPQMQAPPSLPQPPSLWQRIQQNLMPSPEGLAGLISGADVSHARNRGLLDMGLSLLANSRGQGGGNAPGFGQALAGGVQAMRSGYGEDINNAAQGRVQGAQLSQQKAVLQGRQAIGQFLKTNITGDRDNDLMALRKAYMMSTAIGDTDMMKSLSPLLEKDPAMEFHPPMDIDAGDHRLLVDPRTGKTLGSVPINPKPIDPQTAEDRKTRLQMAIDAANARGDAQTAARLSQQANKEDRFITTMQSDPDFKYGTAVAQVAGQLGALRPKAMTGDPFAQYQAIEAALRLRNPEMNRPPNPADYHTLAMSMGLKGKLLKVFDNYAQGTILPAEAMNRLFETSDTMVAQGRARYNASRKYHLGIAQRQGVDPSIVPDAFATIPEGPVQVSNPLMRQ